MLDDSSPVREDANGAAPLVMIKRQPFNAETPPDALRMVQTPNPNFYVRSNFPSPELGADWRLRVSGAVNQPFAISLEELQELPSSTLSVTLECAGNGRLGFSPLPQGEPWGWGAVSTAEWTGVPLRVLLARAGLKSGVLEIMFEGADTGVPSSGWPTTHFGRSLPLDKALHPDTLLAYGMNGEALPAEHGGPVRLLVPGWYGMASVKWLASIKALEEPYTGYYQRERYVLDYASGPEGVPVRAIQVRAMITSPHNGAVVQLGKQTVSGLAWSGEAPIKGVEVNVEGGGEWRQARLLDNPDQMGPYSWVRWEFNWEPTKIGRHALRARAIDAKGTIQPDAARWNRLGYMNNSVQPVVVNVE